MDKTKVVFRKYVNGEIIALFPDGQMCGKILSYLHNGQHADVDKFEIIHCTKPAYYQEYKNLLNELKSIYGDLKIMKRITRR